MLRRAWTVLLVVGVGGCIWAERVGPYVLTTVAAQEEDSSGNPRDWVEICNRGDRDRTLSGWSLRAVVGGQEVTVLTFGTQDVLHRQRRNVVGAPVWTPDVTHTFNLPQDQGRVVLRLYDAERTLVDEMPYTPGTAQQAVATRRRCDCRSNGAQDGDVVTLPRNQLTPGQEPQPACLDPVPAPDAGQGDAGPTPLCQRSGCHPWFPIASAGAAWTYALEGGSAADEQTVTPTGPAANNTLGVHTEAVVGGATSTQDAVYRCANGLLEQVSLQTQSTTTTSTTTFNPPLRLLVEGMAVGSHFSQTVNATVVADTPLGHIERTVVVTQQVNAVGTETVAGVDTVKVVQDAVVDGTAQQGTTWYAPGQGVVKQTVPPIPGSTAPTRTWVRTACE